MIRSTVTPTRRQIALIAGDGHPQLAQQIARRLGVPPLIATVSAFADGETRVRVEAEVLNADVYIVQPTSTPTSERLMTLALLADAARGAGAARITAVLPYFGFARQDVVKQPGEPHSAQLACRMLRSAGVHRAIVLELHSPALESAFDMPVLQLSADDAMLPAIRGWALNEPTIVSPDAGGMKRAQRYAQALGAPLAVVVKTRPATDVAAVLQVLGDVRGRACVIVDDMASTGCTLAAAAQALIDAGAGETNAAFVHAVMAPGALDRIRASPLRHIVTTDSVATDIGSAIERVSVAPLLAAAVARMAGVQAPTNTTSETRRLPDVDE